MQQVIAHKPSIAEPRPHPLTKHGKYDEVRQTASQAVCRGFDSLPPLHPAAATKLPQLLLKVGQAPSKGEWPGLASCLGVARKAAAQERVGRPWGGRPASGSERSCAR